MAITKASAQTTINSGATAAAATTINQILVAPATATSVAGGGSLGVTISNIAITDSTFANVFSGDAAVSSAGGFVKVTGSGFKTGANVFFNNTLVTNTFVSSTQINANIPAVSVGTYSFYIFNTDGTGAAAPSIAISGPPVWTITSYQSSSLLLGIQLVATGDAPLTYYIQPGSANPQNLTVNSTGYLSGTVSSEGSYTITVIVDDAQFQSTQADITVSVEQSDPYFRYNTLLLSADGTNNANNHSFIDSSSSQVFTRVGNPSQGSWSPFSQTGWSYQFDGTNDYITVSNTSGILGSGDYTIEFWCATRDTSWEIFAPASGSMLAMIISGGSFIYQNTYGVAGPINTSATAILDGQWHHVALTRNSGNVSVWYDGVYQASTTNITTDYSAFTSNIDIGYGVQSAGRYLNGYLSNFRVVNGTALYTNGFTPPTAPLTAVSGTTLLTCNSNRFRDTGSTKIVKATVAPGAVPWSPFAPSASYNKTTVGGSGYFDGSGDSLTRTVGTGMAFGTGNYTIEVWAYANSVSDARCVFFTKSATNSYTHILRYASTTLWELYYPGGSTSFTHHGANNAYKQWTHHAFVRNSGTFRWYVNGEQVFSVANSTDVTDNYLEVGNYANYFWNGYIADVRVVKGTAVYTSNFTPPTAPLTAIAGTEVLLNFTNAGIIDGTAKHVIETNDGAKISTASSKFGTGSAVFDGTSDSLRILSTGSYATKLLSLETLPFTIEFWINPNVVNQSAVWLFDWNTDPRLQIDGQTLGWLTAGTARITSGNILTAGVWTHVALVRSGGITKLYADGVQTGSSYTDSTNYSQQNFVIGGGSPWFNGYLDDIRITKGYARYTANFTPPTTAHRLR